MLTTIVNTQLTSAYRVNFNNIINNIDESIRATTIIDDPKQNIMKLRPKDATLSRGEWIHLIV